MRPLKLVMQAFGSYGNRTEIDFEKPDQNLFLITGNTGSGKTTIFDAIVFALYGEASSNANKKNGAELQSQFVEIGTEPFVSLTFSEKNGTEIDFYTVKRIPRHVRPLKRGSGEKMVSEEVSLTMPDGKRDGCEIDGDCRTDKRAVYAGCDDRSGRIHGTSACKIR